MRYGAALMVNNDRIFGARRGNAAHSSRRLMERPASDEQHAFQDALVRAASCTGRAPRASYGRGPAFVAVFEGVDRFVSDAGRSDEPEVFRFPAVFPREALVRTDYLRSFPDLVGSIHGFDGDDRAHAALLRELDEGADWSASLSPADLVLLPAACYPLYPMLEGELPEGGRLFDVQVCASAASPPTTRRACRRFTCTSSCTSARPTARSRFATGGSNGRSR